MKKYLLPNLVWLAVLGAFLILASPANARSHAMMGQAMDLIQQAWNPGGNAPSKETRVKLLNQAMELLQNDPYEGYQGHRAKAIRYVNASLFSINNDSSPTQINNYLQDAVRQCRSALANAVD